MPTIHTNYLTGNDTTGDGSVALPYKSIVKALSVAVDNDLVKVAGGELVPIAGATVTTTNRSTTISTSTNLTAEFTPGDSIFFDTSADDGYPMAANGMVVTNITSTTITVATGSQIKAGTYTPYKLSTYHYTSTSTVNFENFTVAPIANIVTIEGGWDATFTTQIGWTGVKYQASGSSANFFNQFNYIRPNIVLNKFLISNLNNAFQSSGGAIGINEIILNRVVTPFATSNFGVHSPSALGFTTIYAYNTNMNGTWGGGANRPVTLNLKQWITTTGPTNFGLKIGVATQEGATAGPTIRTLEGNWRSMGSAQFVGEWGVIGSTASQGDVYIEQLNMFIGGNTVLPIIDFAQTAQAWRWIGNTDVTIFDNSRCGIVPFRGVFNTTNQQTTSESPLNLNRTSGPLEALPWMSYGSPSAAATVINAQRASLYGKDSQGQKVIPSDCIPKYADPIEYVTGFNSMRYKIITSVSGVDNYRYFCAILNKPTSTASFVVTVKLKASKNITIGNPELLYGPAGSKFGSFTPSTTAITTSWQDITFTVNPAILSDWNLADDGLMQVLIPISSTQIATATELAYLWIDSVTVS